MAKRIDFKFVKEHSDFLVVLEHYGLEASGSGVSRTISCPFHDDATPSCKVNLGRKGFHCFGCTAKGNAIEFVRRMEELPEDDLRGAARKLALICRIPTAPPPGGAGGAQGPVSRAAEPVDAQNGSETMKTASAPLSARSEAPAAPDEPDAREGENVPLAGDFVERFEAKLVREHEYLAARGLTPELVARFGLGVFPAAEKGMMRNRLVIPIHDERGRLLAYAGRWVGPDETIPAGEGKYKLPKGFRKERVLYNLHRVAGRTHLIVVEGFLAVIALHKFNVPAVALMGHELSARHLELLEEAGVKRLTFLLDGDDAGRQSVPSMMQRLAASPLRAKFAVLPEGTQPDTVAFPVLAELLRLG